MSEEDLQRQVDEVRDDIKNIRENHLIHLQEDITELKVSVGKVISDVKWVKLIGGFLVIQAITVLIKLFIK